MSARSLVVSAALSGARKEAEGAGPPMQDETVFTRRPAAEETLVTLARCLGRQAAKEQFARGFSLWEIAVGLAIGALIIGLMSYAGLFLGGPR